MKIIIITYITLLSILFGTDFAIISDLGTSARSIGLGNIQGFSNSAETVFENPAGLSRISRYNLSVFNTTILDDVHYYNINLATNTKYGYFGVGLYEASVKSIPETYINESTTLKKIAIKDTFDYKDNIFKVGYALNLNESLSVGLTGTLYDRKYYTVTGSSFNFDFGILKRYNYFTTSFVIKNMLPKKQFEYNNGSSETIPTDMILTLKSGYKSFEFYPQLRWANQQALFSFGTLYDPEYIPLVHFLFGYKEHLSYTNEKQQTGTIGVGLVLLDMSFYYAFEKSDYKLNDNNSYFSIHYNF